MQCWTAKHCTAVIVWHDWGMKKTCHVSLQITVSRISNLWHTLAQCVLFFLYDWRTATSASTFSFSIYINRGECAPPTQWRLISFAHVSTVQSFSILTKQTTPVILVWEAQPVSSTHANAIIQHEVGRKIAEIFSPFWLRIWFLKCPVWVFEYPLGEVINSSLYCIKCK